MKQKEKLKQQQKYIQYNNGEKSMVRRWIETVITIKLGQKLLKLI